MEDTAKDLQISSVEPKVTPKKAINRKKRRKQRDPKRLSFKIKFDTTSDNLKPSPWSDTVNDAEKTPVIHASSTGDSDVDSGIEGTLDQSVVAVVPRKFTPNLQSSFMQHSVSDGEDTNDTALDLSRTGNTGPKSTQSQVTVTDARGGIDPAVQSRHNPESKSRGSKRTASPSSSRFDWQHKIFKVSDSIPYQRRKSRAESGLQQTRRLLHSSFTSGSMLPRNESDRTTCDQRVPMATSAISRLGPRPIVSRPVEKPSFGDEINNNADVRPTSKMPDTFQQLPNGHKGLNRSRRIVANARERNRVHTISAAFEGLRRAVPCYSHNQKLSKLAILRIACSYILALAKLADLDYSPNQNKLSFSECVDLCTMTLQAEGRSKRKKSHDWDQWNIFSQYKQSL